MATEMAAKEAAKEGTEISDSVKTARARAAKVLPTDRTGFDKQLAVLRAFAAASGPERKAVSNEDVSAIVQMHKNTVSICNPFFVDVGLLAKEGQKQKPSDDVFNYAAAHEWDADKAPLKLAAALRNKWFATVLIPKLAFRPLSKEEAVGFLAEEAKASKEFKPQLELLLDYLRVVGIINFDGATATLGPLAREGADDSRPPAPNTSTQDSTSVNVAKPEPSIDESRVERFSVPIPGKESATLVFPKDLDRDDWNMLKGFMEAYMKRLKKWED